MERVLYFSGFRLSAFHWQKNKLVGQFTFDPSDGGYSKFDDYIKKTKEIPTRFLVDIIEEDFKQDTIPLVRGKDRRHLLQRTIDRLFRGSDYTAMLSQGKNKENKHKEVVLFSALTNPGLMKPWINKLESAGVPFIGIWSVPMMSHMLLKHLKEKSKSILLISQQVPSSLRQTFFSDGKLVFSRLSKVKYDLREVNDAMSYAILLANEIEQTERYLTNQRLIGFHEKLSVCCLVRGEFAKDITVYLEPTEELEYRIYSIEKLEKKLGYKTKPASQFSEKLFSRLCYQHSPRKDHYSMAKERQNYNEYCVSRLLFKTCISSILCTMLASMFFVFDGIQLKDEASDILKVSNNKNTFYETNYAPNENYLSRAIAMQSAVELARTIKHEAQIHPKSFYLVLSKIISKEKYSSLTLENLQWQKELASNARTLISENSKSNDDMYDPYMDEEAALMMEEEGMIDSKLHLVTLKGRVPIREKPYREIVATLNSFIEELEEKDYIDSVNVIDLPIDTRQESSFTDENVSPLLENKNDKSEGNFTIQIVMKEPSHV